MLARRGAGSHISTTPNHGLEPTPSSVRSSLAPASGRGSGPAFGHCVERGNYPQERWVLERRL